MAELAVSELVNAPVSSHREVPPNAGRRLELDPLDRTGGGLEALLQKDRRG